VSRIAVRSCVTKYPRDFGPQSCVQARVTAYGLQGHEGVREPVVIAPCLLVLSLPRTADLHTPLLLMFSTFC